MPTRREFLAGSAALGLGAHCGSIPALGATVVNDIHSQLNRTSVEQVVRPTTLAEIQSAVRTAQSARKALSIAGGRHAMGGQQFGEGTVLVDMRGLTKLLNFDRDAGTLEVEAGVFWPELISAYLQVQAHNERQWGIAQKQTGADRLTIGGTLAANAHGRGLTMKPFIDDIESFKLVNADGNVLSCDRKENSELFRLAIGGYGLLGIVSSVTLRLIPRQNKARSRGPRFKRADASL